MSLTLDPRTARKVREKPQDLIQPRLGERHGIVRLQRQPVPVEPWLATQHPVARVHVMPAFGIHGEPGAGFQDQQMHQASLPVLSNKFPSRQPVHGCGERVAAPVREDSGSPLVEDAGRKQCRAPAKMVLPPVCESCPHLRLDATRMAEVSRVRYWRTPPDLLEQL